MALSLRVLSAACLLALSACSVRSAHELSLDTRHAATPTEIRVEGDHAYDYGVYEVAGERNGQAWGPTLGKYVIVWRRGPEGWRIHLDMWNSRPQPRP